MIGEGLRVELLDRHEIASGTVFLLGAMHRFQLRSDGGHDVNL